MTGFLALTAPPASPLSGDADVWQGDGVTLLAEQTTRVNGPAIAERGPFAIAAETRLDNRDDLRRALGAADGDADLLLAAYERWGEAFVDRLEGAFSFALWDGRAGRLHVARDAMGLRPLYRARVGDGWAFGSRLSTVGALVPFRIDREAAADFLVGDLDHPTRTVRGGVERVPPATSVVVAPGGAVYERSFWSPVPLFQLPDDDAVVEGAFRDAFDRSVLARLDDTTGAMLSGGFDSSSIVVTVRDLRPAPPLHTFSLVYDERLANERRYVDAVIEGGGLVPHRVEGEGVPMFEGLDGDLAAVGEPFPTPNLFLTRHLYAEAGRLGLGAVLDGFGGDNVVGHGTERLTELAYGLRLPTFVREVRAAAGRTNRPRRNVLRIARNYVLDPLAAPLRRPTATVHFGDADLVGDRSERDRKHWSARAAHRAEMSSRLIPRAMEVAYASGAAAGIEPRFPFLDRRLVEVCLALPPGQRLRDGFTRSVLRRSLDDRLPELLRRRAGKANIGNNFTDAFFSREADLLRETVHGDARAASDVLDLPALRRAYERAERDPTLRTSLALPLWRAAMLARWAATASERSPSLPEEGDLLSHPALAGAP